jgi:hypothetical protein
LQGMEGTILFVSPGINWSLMMAVWLVHKSFGILLPDMHAWCWKHFETNLTGWFKVLYFQVFIYNILLHIKRKSQRIRVAIQSHNTWSYLAGRDYFP